MAVYELGLAIKARREQLGYSQEDLAYGICAVSTLSRIENGTHYPKNGCIERILERLGYSAMQLNVLGTSEHLELHEAKVQLRQAVIDADYTAAREYYDALEHKTKKPNCFDKQFLVMYRAILGRGKISATEELALLEEAIQLTCPKYKTKGIPKLLSYDEIIVLNNLAICYGRMENRSRAIEILSAIQQFYDRLAVYREEALRTQPMILYNLSKYLGLEGRYDECIAICDLGIQVARKSGRCTAIVLTLYNRAWAMLRRDRPGDNTMADESLRQAYGLAFGLEKPNLIDAISKLYKENFGKEISIGVR